MTIHFKAAAGVELSKTGVTRQLLWQEYLAHHPDGYSYSRYCHHLNQYLKNRDLSMHLEYQASDSKEFYRYVLWSQAYQDLQTEKMFAKLA